MRFNVKRTGEKVSEKEAAPAAVNGQRDEGTNCFWCWILAITAVVGNPRVYFLVPNPRWLCLFYRSKLVWQTTARLWSLGEEYDDEIARKLFGYMAVFFQMYVSH